MPSSVRSALNGSLALSCASAWRALSSWASGSPTATAAAVGVRRPAVAQRVEDLGAQTERLGVGGLLDQQPLDVP